MKISDFDFFLPRDLIANEPVAPRDACKLMVLNKITSGLQHKSFFDLPEFLTPGDVLVFNNSRVIPARIIFSINKKNVEIFLTKRISENSWLVIGKPGKLLQPGKTFKICKNLECEIIEIKADGQRLVKFSLSGSVLDEVLKKAGLPPFPPYIKQTKAKLEDYQTVYARDEGSIAAPTAGLHFTADLLERLKARGIKLEFVTLHVGLGTFLPVKSKLVEDHTMHSEMYSLDQQTAERLNLARKERRKIIAVGTTSVRVLESSFSGGKFNPIFGETNIYIFPGYKWKCVDGIITNFHLPKSTLLLLVSSFAGKDFILRAYQEAIKYKYRFYSFGDAMFIS